MRIVYVAAISILDKKGSESGALTQKGFALNTPALAFSTLFDSSFQIVPGLQHKMLRTMIQNIVRRCHALRSVTRRQSSVHTCRVHGPDLCALSVSGEIVD